MNVLEWSIGTVAGVGACALLYRGWCRRQRQRRETALAAERWRRMQLLLPMLEEIFCELEKEMRPGVTPVALAEFMEALALQRGVRASTRGFRGFPAPACISVNDVFVNAVPTDRPIARGDIVNVQFGLTDGLAFVHQTWAYSVGRATEAQSRLLRAAVDALERASRAAKGDGRVGDISAAIQSAAQAEGCEPNRDFMGSGIWESPFAPPQIPCYAPSEADAVPLQPGMVLLVQAILHSGMPEVEVLQDMWSVRSKDGGPAVCMSQMVLVKEDRGLPLTRIRQMQVEDSPRGKDEVA